MHHIIPFALFEAKTSDEIFSAYHGRYRFNVSKAYNLIRHGRIKSELKSYTPDFMHYLAHPEFNVADPKKVRDMKIDYKRPLGLVVKFRDPESGKTEWMLIDGNHRTRKAVEEKRSGVFHVVSDPKDVEQFLEVDLRHPHKAFLDDVDERLSAISQILGD